jgi:hypothetical protein
MAVTVRGPGIKGEPIRGGRDREYWTLDAGHEVGPLVALLPHLALGRLSPKLASASQYPSRQTLDCVTQVLMRFH